MKTLPYITIVGKIYLPNNDVKEEIVVTKDIRAIEVAMEENDRMICVLLKESKASNFIETCLVARIIYKMEQSGSLKVKLSIVSRGLINLLNNRDDYNTVDYEDLLPFSSSTDADEKFKKDIIDLIEVQFPQIFLTPKHDVTAFLKAKELTDLDVFCNIVCSLYHISFYKTRFYLEELNTTERLKQLLADLSSFQEFKAYDEEIERLIQESMSEAQKKYYLNEKRKAIAQELGEDFDDEDIDALKDKVRESNLPEHLKKIALKELQRLQSMPLASAEAGVSKNYIDFILSLPTTETIDSSNLSAAQAELDNDHYGLTKVKERILEYIASKMMSGKNPQAVLCLVGPPGVGKTSIARSVATALGKNFVKQSLGGVKDESEIRGHRRTYVGALPGKILSGMVKAGSLNPLFLLDEIDKLSSDYKGDPASALLEVLDSEQNHLFQDHYLDAEFDLSKVFFITTANYIENIPAPLRDRLEIIEMSSYTVFEKLEIAKRHLVKKQLELHGLDPKLFSITDEAILKLIKDYTREAGVRELERLIGSLIRKTMKKIMLKEIESASITDTDLSTWLGKARYISNHLPTEDEVGLVNGLAYTEAGGDTLQIEATTFKGDGKLILTGSLGDVMKESAETAFGFIKSKALDFGIDEEVLANNDIHIHFPEGAVPKDGPSAGVAISLAIVSALTKRKVNHTVAMTGEITLTGNVLPIGGLREKSIAASRDGVKTIYIPKENEVDLDEVPDTVKESLVINFVSHASEVINACLIK